MKTSNKNPKYYLNKNGEFIITNYNHAKPFSNFFPGISGKYGIPMWAFYVNRAQAISSFGIQDKNHAIMEFFPANKAWQFTSLQGFRTFIKIKKAKNDIFYEPFQNNYLNSNFDLTNEMAITSFDLKLKEDNSSLGLKIKVEYFTIPQDSYAGLARIVTLTNTSKKLQSMQVIDGMPQVVPYGTNNWCLKKMSRTIEAWMNIENLDKSVPYYKLDVDPADRPEVIHIREGNFYLGFHDKKYKPEIIKPIVDPETIFGALKDLSYPQKFLDDKKFKYPKNQEYRNRTSCGFCLLDFNLKPGEEKNIYSVIGYMRNIKMLNKSVPKIISDGYLSQKRVENRKTIESIQEDINTKSSSKEFDLYNKQTYLDNLMRGGYPVVFSDKCSKEQKSTVFYLYSRKHGDPERDYNQFNLAPTYFSQGNGNYRDLNQNRRTDIWFNPEIKEENITTLLNLIQPDGFNPLVIKGMSYTLNGDIDIHKLLSGLIEEKNIENLAARLKKPFTPGELIFFIEENNIKLKVSYDNFLNTVMSNCSKSQEAEHGEGFWADHWTYNLDLIDSYLGVYPENLRRIMLEKKDFTFYDNYEVVKPRREKYLLENGTPMQLHSVATDPDKKELIRNRGAHHPHLVRSDYGKGDIYYTTLINKLFCLFANKITSLDPFGVGIEMESGKPNWFDALNGLPGLFGSSLCETFELKRLSIFLKETLAALNADKVHITEEVYELLFGLSSILSDNIKSPTPDKNFEYWDKSYSLKEAYREKTKFGFSGKDIEVSAQELNGILDNAIKKLDSGISKAANKNTYYSYFINEVTEYEKLEKLFIEPKKFTQKPLPLFLEGQMHALRLSGANNDARNIYTATKNSLLFDKKLKMYKVTASLASMPEEIGRCRIFTPGWLENESIWLHMEYKYLLEIIKHGLYEEFYGEFRNILIPFQNPQKYGRNILENSSFLVSSALSDNKIHGNGFVARLSGSTAELLNIWLLMNLGPKPFFLNDKGELNLTFKPILAGWLFDKKGEYSFNFLSKIAVTYHNPKRKDTFGKTGTRIEKIILTDINNNRKELSSAIIPHPFAKEIRSRHIKQIDIYLK